MLGLGTTIKSTVTESTADIDSSIFKFSEEFARLYEVAEDKYVLTSFDLEAVARCYDDDLLEAFIKIAESHNVATDKIEIINEFWGSKKDKKSSADRNDARLNQIECRLLELKRKKKRLEETITRLKTEEAKGRDVHSTLYPAQNILNSTNNQIKDLEEKLREEKAS